MGKKYAIIVAGGVGSRMKASIPKQFLLLNGKPILQHSIERFVNYDQTIDIIVTLPESEISTWQQLCKEHKFKIKHKVIRGGETRFYSVKNGLKQITEPGVVAVHDGVRPLVSSSTIAAAFNKASEHQTAVPVVPITDSIRKIENGKSFHVDRSCYFLIQTPQCFQTEVLLKAYEQNYSTEFTDDASVVEKFGGTINLTEGNKENIKITTPEDLIIANAFYSS